MGVKLMLVVFSVMGAAHLAASMGFKCTENFLNEEVCGGKGDKTLEALKTDAACYERLKKFVDQRPKFCEDLKKNGVEQACTDVAMAIKDMSSDDKKMIKECLETAYKKAHGVDFKQD